MCGYLSSADPKEKGVVDVILKLYSLNFILSSFSSLSSSFNLNPPCTQILPRHLNQSREELLGVTFGIKS